MCFLVRIPATVIDETQALVRALSGGALALPQSLLIREMRHIDLPYVMGNENAAYDYPWTLNIMRGSLNGADACDVLELGGRIIGHCVVKMILDEAHLLNLCVHPAQQGQGLGRLALDAALQRASQRSATVMFLEVRDSNQSARALYDSVGFNEIGIRRGYYPAASGREDAVVMAKHLKI